MSTLHEQLHQDIYNDFPLVALKVSIILVALVFIALALLVDNKWILAGAFLYEVLP